MFIFKMFQFSQIYWAFLLLAFFVGMLGAGAIAKWGRVLLLVDVPVKRSSHKKTTAKGGGIGIVLVALGYAVYNPLFSWIFPLVALALFSFYGDSKKYLLSGDFFFNLLVFFLVSFLLVFSQNYFFFQNFFFGEYLVKVYAVRLVQRNFSYFFSY